MSQIFANINEHIQEGKFYEASQMYKVLIMRYAKNQKLDTSVQLSIKGIKTFFSVKKVALASELAHTLVVDILQKYDKHMDSVIKLSAQLELTVQQILEDIVRMYTDAGQLEKDDLDSKVKFLKAAVIFSSSSAKNRNNEEEKNSSENGEESNKKKKEKSEQGSASDQGTPSLHLALAQTYEQLNDFKKANTQYVRSHDMIPYAKLLMKWTIDSKNKFETLLRENQNHPNFEEDEDLQKQLRSLLMNQEDLLLTRSVLQVILSTRSHTEAKLLFDSFLSLFKQVTNGMELKRPLVQFNRFLLLAVEKKNYDLLNKSIKSYEQELSRDPKIHEYLKSVSSVVFGVKVVDNSMAGMLNSMLGSLMGGGGAGGGAGGNNPMAALLGGLGGGAPPASNNNRAPVARSAPPAASSSAMLDDDLD